MSDNRNTEIISKQNSHSWPDRLRFTLALCGMVAAAIPMLLTAILVRLSLGKPVFFAQQRSGLHARTFTIRKFRTMRNLRDASGNPLPDDARVTLVGHLLRRLRLDEMPQLFAILHGDMAFIGPRPLLPETIEEFGGLGLLRASVRPGLTGWAQVNGNTTLTNRQKLALDIWYVTHRGPLLDLRILFLTIRTLILGEARSPSRIAAAEACLEQRMTDGGI